MSKRMKHESEIIKFNVFKLLDLLEQYEDFLNDDGAASEMFSEFIG